MYARLVVNNKTVEAVDDELIILCKSNVSLLTDEIVIHILLKGNQ